MAQNNNDGVFALLLGMLLGVAGGAIYGFLYAPKKGKIFRKDVKQWLKNLPELIEDEMEPNSRSRKFIDKTRYNFEDQVDSLNKNRRASRIAKAKQREQEALGFDY